MWTKAYLGWGLLILFSVVSAATFRAVSMRAVLLIRVVRHGRQAEGKVIRVEVPYRKGSRIPRPWVEFIGPDGHQVRFQDLYVDGGLSKPGDTVTVRYDPVKPRESATIGNMRTVRSLIRSGVLVDLLFVGLAVCGLLILLGVIPVTSGT